MMTVQVTSQINFPEINLQSTLEEIADKIIIRDIKSGIVARKAIDGGSLPENDPKTIKAKGKDNPLIDTGELKESFSYKKSGKDKVIVFIDSVRRKIGGYLQNEGIKTNSGRKFYRFFGISKDAYDNSIKYAAKKVKEMLRGK